MSKWANLQLESLSFILSLEILFFWLIWNKGNGDPSPPRVGFFTNSSTSSNVWQAWFDSLKNSLESLLVALLKLRFLMQPWLFSQILSATQVPRDCLSDLWCCLKSTSLILYALLQRRKDPDGSWYDIEYVASWLLVKSIPKTEQMINQKSE